MITVEFLLESLMTLVNTGTERDAWKTNFICNVHASVASGRALTTAQANVVLKLAGQHTSSISNVRKLKVADIQAAISKPVYNRPLVQSQNIPREVRYVSGNKIAFRFKMDEMVIREIKQLKSGINVDRPVFNRKYRIWVVSVNPKNVDSVRTLIDRHKFMYDQATLDLITRTKNLRDTLPSFKYNPETDNLKVVVPNNPFLALLLQASLKGEVQ